MTRKIFYYLGLFMAPLLSIIGCVLLQQSVIESGLLYFTSIAAVVLSAIHAVIIAGGSASGKVNSFLGFSRVLMALNALLVLVSLLYLMGSSSSFFDEINNGILAVCLGISCIYMLYNYGVSNAWIQRPEEASNNPVMLDWLFILILPFIFGIYCVMGLYGQETAVESLGKPDFNMQPSALISAFEADLAKANQQYIGKRIRFSGSVVEKGGDSSILLKLNGWKEGFAVNCEFDLRLKEKLSEVLEGDSIEVQCSCSGLNSPEEGMSLLSESSLDMARCALISNFKNKPNLGTDVEHPQTTEKSTKPKK